VTWLIRMCDMTAMTWLLHSMRQNTREILECRDCHTLRIVNWHINCH